MPYIGRGTDKLSNVEVLDNITFDGSSSYTLQKGGSNFTPSSANTLLLSIDGVVQAGNFTVSGSTIDFGTAVAGTSTCDFILHYGVGLITTPADGTVTTAKLGDSAVTTAKLNDASVSLAKLTATGTKDATTFLRGDNTFAEAGGGKVLQVVSTQNITDFSTSSGTFVDVTGATLTITPSSTSSKILLLCNTNTYQNTSAAYFALRWERDIGGSSTTFGNGTYGQTYARSAVANDFWGGVGMTYLDSPNTTSAITYTVQASTTGSGTMGFGINSANASNIFAIEIGA